MFETTEFWMVVTAIIFTCVGWVMGFNSSTKFTVEKTVDLLVSSGYIKTRKKADGTLELLKHDE